MQFIGHNFINLFHFLLSYNFTKFYSSLKTCKNFFPHACTNLTIIQQLCTDYVSYVQVEEANCADVYEEFVASFEGAASKGKTFVRGNVVNPGQKKGLFILIFMLALFTVHCLFQPWQQHFIVHKLLQASNALLGNEF